jgi:hypothetical protein
MVLMPEEERLDTLRVLEENIRPAHRACFALRLTLVLSPAVL